MGRGWRRRPRTGQPQARDEVGSNLSGSPQVTQPRTVRAQLWAQSRERTLCLQPRPAELCYRFSPGTRRRSEVPTVWERDCGQQEVPASRGGPGRGRSGGWSRRGMSVPPGGAGMSENLWPQRGRGFRRAPGLGGATQGAALRLGLWGPGKGRVVPLRPGAAAPAPAALLLRRGSTPDGWETAWLGQDTLRKGPGPSRCLREGPVLTAGEPWASSTEQAHAVVASVALAAFLF